MNIRNKVLLIGHLGQDPENKTTPNGHEVVRFSLATRESYKNRDGEQVEQTEWHRCVAWGHRAEYARKYLRKGKEIALEGKLRHRSYDDKDGIRRYVTEVEVQEMTMVGKKTPSPREVGADPA